MLCTVSLSITPHGAIAGEDAFSTVEFWKLVATWGGNRSRPQVTAHHRTHRKYVLYKDESDDIEEWKLSIIAIERRGLRCHDDLQPERSESDLLSLRENSCLQMPRAPSLLYV
jgi:hypothetical protein